VEEAEAAACIEGLWLAHRHTGERFILETDCAGVAVTINSTEESRSNCRYLYQEARQLKTSVQECKRAYVMRTGNYVAQGLARLATEV
jgi:hypothetical protein